MTWSSIWYRIRKFFGQLTYEEEQKESEARIRAFESLAFQDAVTPPTLPPMPPHPIPPYNSSVGTFAGSSACSTGMFAGSITKGPENIPGPHPKPKKKKKLQPRCITDDWEVTQDQEK